MAISTKKIIDTKGTFKENLLTPRFYTTNFKEMSELDISSNREEIEAIVEEFRIDYNRDHFIRDKEFLTSWDFFDEKTRDIFIEFLERSCTAEFSGFLLYKEISRNLKKENPLLAEVDAQGVRCFSGYEAAIHELGEKIDILIDTSNRTEVKQGMRQLLQETDNNNTVIVPMVVSYMMWYLLPNAEEIPQGHHQSIGY